MIYYIIFIRYTENKLSVISVIYCIPNKRHFYELALKTYLIFMYN